MFLSACFEFWMLPRSGFRFRKNTNSCCWPAQRPRTHSLLICRETARERERERGRYRGWSSHLLLGIFLLTLTNDKIPFTTHTPKHISRFQCFTHKHYISTNTHAVTLMTLKLRWRLYSIMILYSSVPSSIMCLSVSSVSRLDNTALRHVGSLSWQMTRLLR